MSNRNSFKKLIAINERRLQLLKEKKAMVGIYADPSIQIEIEGIEAILKELRDELEKVKDEPDGDPPTVYSLELRITIPQGFNMVSNRFSQFSKWLGNPLRKGDYPGSFEYPIEGQVLSLQDFPWEPPHMKRYNWKNIRAMLTEGFSAEELRRLCYDEPDFKSVYHQLAQNTGKMEIIDRLIEHANKKLQIDTLLARAEERNPARYEKHQPYYDVTTSPTTSTVLSSIQGLMVKISIHTNKWWPQGRCLVLADGTFSGTVFLDQRQEPVIFRFEILTIDGDSLDCFEVSVT